MDLVALFVASDAVWRISARHGQLDIVNLGALAELLPALNEFRSYPTQVELGQQLGEKLLGREPFRATEETLFVLLDGNIGGEIAGLPIAALRVDGKPLIALRGIVRPARLSELATGFLASGSSQVIATLRPVGDVGAAEIAARFFAEQGVDDPVRTLAHIQSALAQTRNTDWPNFVLYGHDICRRGPQ